MRIFPSANQVDRGGVDVLEAEVREEVLAGRDVFSVSKTRAVERTLAYLQPCYELLDDLYKDKGELSGGIRVLVLVPTRKVANRVRKEAESLGRAGGYEAASCYHSVGAPLTFNMEQLEAISIATVLIATPCKLKDFIKSRQVNLSEVFYLVMDGADKMIQIGLEPNMRAIIKRVPSKRQTLMFSEGLGGVVKKLAKDVLSNPRPDLMKPCRGSVIKMSPQCQPEVRAAKRPAESPPAGEKPKMILSEAQAEAKTGSRSHQAPKPRKVQRAETLFDQLICTDVLSCRAALETPETPVVVRVLRSGVKIVQQPGKKKEGKKKQGKNKEVRKKLISSVPLTGDVKGKTRQPTASPGPLAWGVSFRRSEVEDQTDGPLMSVDRKSWLPVLFSLEDVGRAKTELQVRVRAELRDDLTSTSSHPRYHLIRLAGASLSSYQQDSQGRHSVVFPFKSSVTAYRKIKFTSLTSDLGKEVKVVFSLEDGQGELVSRRVFGVKIRSELTPDIPIIEI